MESSLREVETQSRRYPAQLQGTVLTLSVDRFRRALLAIPLALFLKPPGAVSAANSRTRALLVEDDSALGRARRDRLARRFEEVLGRASVDVKVKFTDIGSLPAIRSALRDEPDHRDLIVLAASALIAEAVVEHFPEATLV